MQVLIVPDTRYIVQKLKEGTGEEWRVIGTFENLDWSVTCENNLYAKRISSSTVTMDIDPAINEIVRIYNRDKASGDADNLRAFRREYLNARQTN